MSKLCYKVNGTIKKYDLKDSTNTPRLVVKSGGTVRYLPLKTAGSNKPGELAIRVGGQKLYVKTWGPEVESCWKGLYPEEPLKGIRTANKNNTDAGGLGIWVLVNEDNYPVVAFGRIGADKAEQRYRGTWIASKAGTTDTTTYPGNLALTAEQLAHPKRLKANLRLVTVTSNCYPDENFTGLRTNYSTTDGDHDSTKTHIKMSDIYTSLTSKSSYIGYVRSMSAQLVSGTCVMTGYGYYQRNITGVYFPDGTEEKMGLNKTYNPGNYTGIDSDGFKVYSYPVGQLTSDYILTSITGDIGTLYTGISTDANHSGCPYIDYSAPGDDNSRCYLVGCWSQRDFYIEYPYAWGEDTNPNDFFTFSPLQVLNKMKALATSLGVYETDYGHTRGRNY